MPESTLEKLFEHNNWANAQIVEACRTLDDEALDAPQAQTTWSLRHTLTHLIECQLGYLSLLTVPLEERGPHTPEFGKLLEAARESGDGLLAIVRGDGDPAPKEPLWSTDGYRMEPWVVLLQSIQHATDHRRQICGMLRALGATPPQIDGWTFGESKGALVPPSD